MLIFIPATNILSSSLLQSGAMSVLQGSTANHRNRDVHAAVLHEGLAIHLQIYTGISPQICRADIVIPLNPHN
jgi:hypothetical protein